MNMISVLALVLSLAADAPVAERLKVGDTVASFKAADQHGAAFEFKPGLRCLLVAFEMSTGKDANKVLEKRGAKYLAENKAVFVSNIHGMPAVGRAFALPKMRKYPHQIILADAEKLLEPFPVQKDRVTVLLLDDKAKIQEVRFWNAETEPLEDIMRRQN